MKIAIVCPNDLAKKGGVQNLSVQMHQHLSMRGHESILISIRPSRSLSLKNVKYFGAGTPVFVNETASEIAWEGVRDLGLIKDYLDKQKFDVVCIHHPYAPFLSLDIINFSKSLNIGWFHTTMAKDLLDQALDFLKAPVGIWLKEKLQGFIAVSSSVFNSWPDIFTKTEGIVLPVGVDVAKFENAKRKVLPGKLNLLFVGRLDERKGVLDAINATQLVLNSGVDANLLIVGDGPDKEKAVSLVSGLGLDRKISFLGAVEDTELKSLYKSADVYIAPSLGGESLGIVLLEAMAAGTPTVAYANEGYKFTLSGSPWKGSLVKVGLVEGLAKSILELVVDKNLRRKVVEWEREKVRSFDWEKITDRFLEYARSLM